MLDDDDWIRIEALLARANPAAPPDGLNESVVALRTALDGLRSAVGDQAVVGANPVINLLLDVWAAARDISPLASRPAEVLLSALVSRDVVSAEEVNAVCDETWVAVAGRRDLSDIAGAGRFEAPGRRR